MLFPLGLTKDYEKTTFLSTWGAGLALIYVAFTGYLISFVLLMVVLYKQMDLPKNVAERSTFKELSRLPRLVLIFSSLFSIFRMVQMVFVSLAYSPKGHDFLLLLAELVVLLLFIAFSMLIHAWAKWSDQFSGVEQRYSFFAILFYSNCIIFFIFLVLFIVGLTSPVQEEVTDCLSQSKHGFTSIENYHIAFNVLLALFSIIFAVLLVSRIINVKKEGNEKLQHHITHVSIASIVFFLSIFINTLLLISRTVGQNLSSIGIIVVFLLFDLCGVVAIVFIFNHQSRFVAFLLREKRRLGKRRSLKDQLSLKNLKKMDSRKSVPNLRGSDTLLEK
eukprot:TRINITY_DN13586_c0_g3_i2.p1 TRINITY_DN13586_c0_g3~~TRINITY_DN13586_c0_g3_i2.p1  ORF type:complete len:333 (+),score=36.57 TRINITY_DN13586_c0_g3_i2:516-1514(+)